MNVILIGFKSSGKSTVGRALARLTGRAFLDADAVSERLYAERHVKALSCRDIVREHGEEFWRLLESDALRSLSGMTDAVLATGGGAVLRRDNIALLRSLGQCVFLDTPLDVLEKRLEQHADSPLFARRGVRELVALRRPLYLEAAHIRLDAPPGADAESVAEAIRDLLDDYGGEAPPPQTPPAKG